MRSRLLRWLVVLVAVGLCLSVGLAGPGIAATTVPDEPDDDEIIETQTVTSGEVQGEIHIEVGYQLGDEILGLEIGIPDPSLGVIETDGFDGVTGETRTYEWDEETKNPTLTVRAEVNRSGLRFPGYDFVDAGDWLLTDRAVPTTIGWTTDAREIDPEEVDLHRSLQAGEEGVAGERMAYLGPYEVEAFAADDERFRLVTSEFAEPEWTAGETGSRLVEASDRIDVGAETEELTVFAVTDPLRRGGVATGHNTEFWVHDATLATQQTTLYHEYVHTRQAYDRADAVEWTIEGGAEYYAHLLALKDGSIEYHQFHTRLDDGNDHGDVVLADPGTWRGSRADYELGALTLAAMDAEIREHGTGTFEAVFRQKNEHHESVSDAVFEDFASDAAGTEVSGFFEEYVRSTPSEIDVPRPVVYDGPNTGADIELHTTALDLEPGESEILTVDIENTGSDRSLAPELIAEYPDAVEVELVGLRDSRLTETDRGWVLDHLGVGQDHTVELLVEAESETTEQIDLAVADLSNQRASAAVTLDSRAALEAGVELPETVELGTTVETLVTTSLDDQRIEGYQFEISGPAGTETVERNQPSLAFDPAESGSYSVSVTVTADDGRTVTVASATTVDEAETQETDEDGSAAEDDGDTDEDAADEDDDSTDDDSTGDAGETHDGDSTDDRDTDGSADDGLGNGFGPAVALAAVLSLLTVSRVRR